MRGGLAGEVNGGVGLLWGRGRQTRGRGGGRAFGGGGAGQGEAKVSDPLGGGAPDKEKQRGANVWGVGLRRRSSIETRVEGVHFAAERVADQNDPTARHEDDNAIAMTP